jgi:hypothetical protein
MPDFAKANGGKSHKSSSPPRKSVVDTSITDPRCKVCQDKRRKVIDKFLARGTSYRELERAFGINHQSIGRHDKNHLNLKDSAIRTILRQEAEDADYDVEEGIQKVIKKQVYLQVALDKAMEAILDGDVTVEPRDAVAIIEKLDDMERETVEAQVIQMKIEFHAIMQAVKEVVPEGYWDALFNRSRELVERSSTEVKRLSG